MTPSRRALIAQRPKKAASSRWDVFVTGSLFGAALVALVPWEDLGANASSVRLAGLAFLGVALAVVGLLFVSRRVRQASSILLICFGGLMMSASAQWSTIGWPVSPVGVGAVMFLCGVTLLLRERRIPAEERELTVDRLIEEPIKNDEPDLTLDRMLAIERLKESERPQDRSGLVRRASESDR